jgi:nucleoside-diphosphate-sugar epimerase
MRIFLAGATGAIGAQLAPRLIVAGHHVAGMTRRESKAGRLRQLGAEPIVCDVFDADALKAAVVAFHPDVVIHQVADLPPDPEQIAAKAADNNRIRREGTSNLLDAARAAGSPRFLAQSVAFELPGDGAAAVQEHEQAVLDAGGVILRYGYFYGPGTYHEAEPAPPPAVHVR